jgi:flagellar biosynthesis chaperone FliJ
MNTQAYLQLNRLAIAQLTTTKKINEELASVLTITQSFTTTNFIKSLQTIKRESEKDYVQEEC